MSTYFPSGAGLAQNRKWLVVDAAGKTVGHLASEVAQILTGKRNPKWTPFMDVGDHVIVVEDEVSSGTTIVNCVRALRAAGIRCDQVATIYAADDPAMRARVAAEGIRLHAALLCQADINEQLYLR